MIIFTILYMFIISGFIPLIVSILLKNDDELSLVYKKKEKLFLYVMGIATLIIIFCITGVYNIKFYFMLPVITVYLVISSYTDEKIHQLYRNINIGFVILFLICFLHRMLFISTDISLIIAVIVYSLLIVLLYIFKVYSFGDVFIFVVIALFIASFDNINLPTFIVGMALHICISSIIYMIVYFRDIFSKQKNGKPFALYLTVGFYILTIVPKLLMYLL